jgi:hypothetical protein
MVEEHEELLADTLREGLVSARELRSTLCHQSKHCGAVDDMPTIRARPLYRVVQESNRDEPDEAAIEEANNALAAEKEGEGSAEAPAKAVQGAGVGADAASAEGEGASASGGGAAEAASASPKKGKKKKKTKKKKAQPEL